MAVDYPQAMAAYKIAAENGHAQSQYQVGMMYRHGRSVAQNYKQAIAWFEKAAAQDHPDAVGQLGVMVSLSATKLGKESSDNFVSRGRAPAPPPMHTYIRTHAHTHMRWP